MSDVLYRASELERRLENMLRIGTVAELDEGGARVRVRAGNLLTAWLPWLTRRAGEDRDWWAPEPGEQVLILAPSGDLAQAVALPALYRQNYPAPAQSRTTRRETYSDGAVVAYDRAGHHYLVDIPAGGSVTIRCGAASIVLTDAGVQIAGPRVDLN
ncbi:phage baseplate assembly protein V [Desulfobulbus elongatus]|uniref:phage baseplate assembly protein V n=1 Tax=Desulfobulbus elongatus TaxID=53332 RepID=UPI0004829DF2|nr:phage baseplate assembly protein V [Desulfobulbus elongatus]